MQIENDAECNVKWTPTVALIVIIIGLILCAIAEVNPLENAIECRNAGIACIIAGMIGIPLHVAQLRRRCRSVISEEGIEFLPSENFGSLSFRWASVSAWSWVTEHHGNGEETWHDTFIRLELRDGHVLKLPQRHFHHAITNELVRRVNPQTHQNVYS